MRQRLQWKSTTITTKLWRSIQKCILHLGDADNIICPFVPKIQLMDEVMDKQRDVLCNANELEMYVHSYHFSIPNKSICVIPSLWVLCNYIFLFPGQKKLHPFRLSPFEHVACYAVTEPHSNQKRFDSTILIFPIRFVQFCSISFRSMWR